MNKLYLIIVFLLAACSSKLMAPSSIDLPGMQKKVPSITIEKATAGHKLYVQYCGSCHHLYEPARFTDNEWNHILVKMLPKTKVSNITDQQLIKDYLISLSK